MTKGKLKQLLPSLREKKRYLAYEVISNNKIMDFRKVNEAILEASHKLHGLSGTAEAGMINLENKWNAGLQKGILKISHKQVDKTRAALTFVTKVDSQNAVIRSVGMSGILKKAEKKFIV